jgi:mono/diheme cytochrome c family protein
MRRRPQLGLRLLIATVGLVGAGTRADEPPSHTHPPGTPPHEHPRPSVRVTMDELHRHGGIPPGWRFALPPGDPKEGRGVFTKLECGTCHAIQGERLPDVSKSSDDVGPDLTRAGSHHPAEYLAESIVNPNAVIVIGRSYVGADGLSRMPDYSDVLTVRQLIDLVAYLRSLTAEPARPKSGPGTTSGTPRHPMPQAPPTP